jgi:hypothetical protein
MTALEEGFGFFAVARKVNGKTLLCQGLAKNPADAFFVVGYQNAFY